MRILNNLTSKYEEIEDVFVELPPTIVTPIDAKAKAMDNISTATTITTLKKALIKYLNVE